MADAPTQTSPPAAPRYRGAGLPQPPISPNRAPLSRDLFRFFPKLDDLDLHPKSWTLPRYLDNPAIPWLRTLKDLYASPLAFPASISPEAGLLLFSLVRNIRPRVVVEVGTFIGISTIWIAAALEEAGSDPTQAPGPTQGLIHCFDDFGPVQAGPWRDADLPDGRLPLVRANLERAGLAHRVAFHPGDSSVEIVKLRDTLRGPLDALYSPWNTPFVGAQGGPGAVGGVDLALLDGNHTIDGVLQDLWAVEPVLNTGGYILLHDTFPEQCGEHQGPRHLIDQLQRVAQGVYQLCDLYTAPLNYGMALLRRIG